MKTLARITMSIVLFCAGMMFPLSGSHANAEVYQADAIPWSGYWWPMVNGGLSTGRDYRGHPAPLEKYELIALGYTPGDLVLHYNKEFYEPSGEDWYGMCANWARAATHVNIDFMPSVENNIVFRVGDKKGMLTMAYTSGFWETADGSQPDVFHLWLLSYIRDQKKSFSADLDPTIEVWVYPIYKYDMQTMVNGNVESVTVEIFYADDNVDPDIMGTFELSNTYTYDLFLDNQGNIQGGEWTGNSVNDHPQVMTFSMVGGVDVPGMDFDIVMRLAEAVDDELESADGPPTIQPGTYNLVLLDEDAYRLDCRTGDAIRVKVEKQDGSKENMDVILTDGNGATVASTTVTGQAPFEMNLVAEAPPYQLVITQPDYTDPNIYSIVFDMRKILRRLVPYIPKSGDEWSGIGITNFGDTPAEGVILTTYATDHTADAPPIQTVYGPVTLEPGEKRTMLFDELSVRVHELADSGKLAMMADSDSVYLLNLFGTTGPGPLACFGPTDPVTHLIIPDTVPTLAIGRTMFGEVINSSFEPSTIQVRIYTATGTLRSEFTQTLEPWELLHVRASSNAFSKMTDGGWIDIAGGQDDQLLAYQYTETSSTMESLHGLHTSSSRKWVPHVPETGFWQATATIFNPNDAQNRILFHPMRAGSNTGYDYAVVLEPGEKRIIDLQDHFGAYPGHVLYESVIELTGELQFAGYYAYITPTDNVTLPLLEPDDAGDELLQPHYAGNDGFWWTGVGICNPTYQQANVRAVPYNYQGIEMTADIKTLSLPAGGYEAFLGVHLFGTAVASDIDFVKFFSDGPAVEGMAGFYLYGLHTGEKLSGANM